MNSTQIDVGKQIRLSRISNPETGRMVLVPLDHGVLMGPMAGIRNPAGTVDRLAAGGADAVIFNAGLAHCLHSQYMSRCGAIFNLINIISVENDLTLVASVEYALRQAADAVSVQVQIGSPYERHMIQNFQRVADACSRWGLPLLAMMYPTEEFLAQRGAEAQLLAARAGAELGADIVKTSYTGHPKTFRQLVEGCPVPVVIAGGPKKNTEREVLEMVEEAIGCGAAGVALGRNVWQSHDPAEMTRALVEIIHGGRSVSDLQWDR